MAIIFTRSEWASEIRSRGPAIAHELLLDLDPVIECQLGQRVSGEHSLLPLSSTRTTMPVS